MHKIHINRDSQEQNYGRNYSSSSNYTNQNNYNQNDYKSKLNNLKTKILEINFIMNLQNKKKHKVKELQIFFILFGFFSHFFSFLK